MNDDKATTPTLWNRMWEKIPAPSDALKGYVLAVVLFVTVGSILGLVYLAIYGDQNSGPTAVNAHIHTVEVCPGDWEPGEVEAALVYWGLLPAFDPRAVQHVDSQRCSEPISDGILRIQPCSTAVPAGELLCLESPDSRRVGRTRMIPEGGPYVGGYLAIAGKYDRFDHTCRLNGRRMSQALVHEIGHSYGLGFDYPDGKDGHDQHATRIMGKEQGCSFEGLNVPLDELDVVWLK